MPQGKWTRIRPLQISEVDDYTASAFRQAELTWGHFPNNLVKVMGHCPSLAITEVPYSNSFIFDIDIFNKDKQFAGFLDRPLKELCISRTSLYNRSRYSITHHAYIGYSLFKSLNREKEGHKKFLHLHEHKKFPKVYTAREKNCLDYAVKICDDPHKVTNKDWKSLKKTLDDYNKGKSAKEMTDFDLKFIEKWKTYSDEQYEQLLDSQLVELTWLISHFCLLNRWFTVLQVPDEGHSDEVNFLKVYEDTVPLDIRKRNDNLLGNDF